MIINDKNLELEYFDDISENTHKLILDILDDMVKKPFKRKVIIEVWEKQAMMDYFNIHGLQVRKANGTVDDIEGIYTISKNKEYRGIAIVNNENLLTTLVHELTHALDFDKMSNWVYSLKVNFFKYIRRLDPYEKRAWNNEIEFCIQISGCRTCMYQDVCEWLEQKDFCMGIGFEEK